MAQVLLGGLHSHKTGYLQEKKEPTMAQVPLGSLCSGRTS